MLNRIFPHPYLTLLLVVVWQMLVNSIGLGSLAFGLILGLIVPLVTSAYWPDRPRLKNLPMIVEYILVVLWDIVIANVVVARTIVFKRNQDMRPAWVAIPLELRTPEAITVLAGTITMTPGTLSAEVSACGRSLLVHCLDAPDPAAVRDEIKDRYERRLKEIFE
ncbi:MAG TPA: Na+/H+ antiporter subunit E [Paracoccaceae bacterium]|nr:Na+/H+ antiporter subunit E [Paracoccaceae bacterium]